ILARKFHYIFFLSSRRQHTRCYRDWSSDVCSSDPWEATPAPALFADAEAVPPPPPEADDLSRQRVLTCAHCRKEIENLRDALKRSEERRVGNEGMSRDEK